MFGGRVVALQAVADWCTSMQHKELLSTERYHKEWFM